LAKRGSLPPSTSFWYAFRKGSISIVVDPALPIKKSRLAVFLSVAVVPHTDHRYRSPTSLASQRNIPQERLAGGAPPPYQQRPRDIGDTSTTRAGRSQMRVTLGLGFGDAVRQYRSISTGADHCTAMHRNKVSGTCNTGY